MSCNSFLRKCVHVILSVALWVQMVLGVNNRPDSGQKSRVFKVYINHKILIDYRKHKVMDMDMEKLSRYLRAEMEDPWRGVGYIIPVNDINDADYEVKVNTKLKMEIVSPRLQAAKRVKRLTLLPGLFASGVGLGFWLSDFPYPFGYRGAIIALAGAGAALVGLFSWGVEKSSDVSTYVLRVELEPDVLGVIDLRTGLHYHINKLKTRQQLPLSNICYTDKNWNIKKIKVNSLYSFIGDVYNRYNMEIFDALCDHFKGIVNENERPVIVYNKSYTYKIRANRLRIPMQLEDDVELGWVAITNRASNFNVRRLLGGYKAKAYDIEVPLSVGENNIVITVEDWCGNLTSQTISVYALKDPENRTATLGSTEGTDILVVDEEPIEEVNVDIVPRTNMRNPEAIAVVIGNRNYSKISDVEYAHNDARTICEMLINTLGYKRENVILVLDASKTDFETYFGNESNYRGKLYNMTIPGKSDIFVYYSGHGIPSLNNKKGYLAPVECDPNYIELSGYSLETFYKNLAMIPSRSTTVIMDACFSGVNIYRNISPVVVKIENPLLTMDRATILTSSRVDQVSTWYPEKKHGLFTYFLLEAINDKRADFNGDNQITFGELYRYISDNSRGVPYMARLIHNVEQHPQLITSDDNRVFIKY